jgi:hypothetical protein
MLLTYPISRSAITSSFYHVGGGAVRWIFRFSMLFDDGKTREYAVEDSIHRQGMKRACKFSDRLVEKGLEGA